MAKVVIAGDAVVITSAMKLKDLQTIAKYRPEALTLKGGEDGKEPIFAISVDTRDSGSINKYGATFGSVTHDAEKLATITLHLDLCEEVDAKTAVAEAVGSAIIQLNTLEGTLPEVLASIEAEKANIMSNIFIA